MKIAIVGAGVTGSVVASELAKFFVGDNDDGNSSNNQVVIFDQGRRGPGGRASHRSVIKKTKTTKKESNTSDDENNGIDDDEEEEEFIVLPDDVIDESSFHFDHGCQFFRADSHPMKDLAKTWLRNGWVEPWKAKFGCLPEKNIKRNDDDDDDNNNSCDNKHNITDFFGIPSSIGNKNNEYDDIYIGVGGMHLLPRRILNSSNATVHPGTRVNSVVRRRREEKETGTGASVVGRRREEKETGTGASAVGDNENGNNKNNENFVWDITTVVGKAAYHDTKESVATAAVTKAMNDNDTKTKVNDDDDDDTASTTRIVVHRGFDIVIFTDISSSSDSWHRASAGVPATFTSRLPTKIRLPLFSCMIALSKPLKDILPFDAFTVNSNNNYKLSPSSTSSTSSNSPLWFAARSDSKPGFPKSSSSNDDDGLAAVVGPAECWTLISTPAFAVNEIRQTTMRDPVTGEFRPQENKYLNSIHGPSHMLKDAFYNLVRPYLNNNNDDDDGTLPLLEEPIYIQGQRWGSGIPIDPERTTPDNIEEICGTQYATSFNGSLVYPPSSYNNSNINSNDDNDIDKDTADGVVVDFLADDKLGLYYAGDFCSSLNPGFEAAALSGFDLAQHIIINR
ncbi:MAG: hypothetical protein ACI90V_013619 [Bacillariaceae sp.]|jgi:hypothetical protein